MEFLLAIAGPGLGLIHTLPTGRATKYNFSLTELGLLRVQRGVSQPNFRRLGAATVNFRVGCLECRAWSTEDGRGGMWKLCPRSV